mgnify:CR=1 FL=1
MKPLNPYLKAEPGENIFTAQTRFAIEHGAINLGQGLPQHDGPGWFKDIALKHLKDEGLNQYGPPAGLAETRDVIADLDQRYYGLPTDPDKNVIVTAGATEGLNISLRLLLEPGDEVILFSPYYNFYNGLIGTTGAKPVFVPLRAPDWHFDPDDIRRAISPKTKAILMNTPSNPTAKIFTKQELNIISDIARENDLYVISDEVYEFLTPPDRPHIPISSLPEMFERTIRISSAGKTFSLTGWRMGYLSAPEHLVPSLLPAHVLASFCVPGGFQKAMAAGLEKRDYLSSLGPAFGRKADILAKGLEQAGFRVLHNGGGYFLIADFGDFEFDGSDVEFCYYLTKEIGVTPLPMSPFCPPGDKDAPKTLLRFCIAQDDKTLTAACEKLEALKTTA